MEEEPDYIVEITPQAEIYFFQLLEYLYQHHSARSASEKADEILKIAMSLNKNPHRGRMEDKLSFLGKKHRFLLYQYTPRKTVKIIYFVDEPSKKVYITDFFGTEMDDTKIRGRNKGRM